MEWLSKEDRGGKERLGLLVGRALAGTSKRRGVISGVFLSDVAQRSRG